MSLFRKQAPTASQTPEPAEQRPPQPAPQPQAQPQPQPAQIVMFSGASVDLDAVYKVGKVSPEDRDRVVRAEELLVHLPTSASHTREVVDATLRAFGVDARKIVDAANKELGALESFIRLSQAQVQRTIEEGAKRIADLEAEIQRCRQVTAQATREGEERARTVNAELTKVQRVLEFFGQQEIDAADIVESEPEHSEDPLAVLRRPPSA